MALIAVVGYAVQARLRSVMKMCSMLPSPQGLTGAEVALKMLHAHGIYNVQVTRVRGHLTDHFNPETLTINLSDSVYSERSVAAMAVACHECGHAVQHATGYAPVRLRSQLVPWVNFSSSIATWVIVLGIALMSATGSALLCWVGIALVAMSALFAIVTLPVEYNASDRAVAWLQSSGMMQGAELNSAREALSWAARTYLVAALSAIATLLYYVSLIMRRK
jgi:Zn-dependent membrane protease YugP